MHPDTIDVLRLGLDHVMTVGTGVQIVAGSNIPSVAGKTGTAEDPPRPNHAWFGCYTPTDQPKLVVVAFAENSGGGGGKVAGPMVRQVLENYYAQLRAGKAIGP
jgi:penicillin-binding protein 2